MKKVTLLLIMILAIQFTFSQKNVDEKIYIIKENFRKIEAKTTWKKVDSIQFGNHGKGGQALYFYSKDSIDKISINFFGEEANKSINYFLIDEDLSYVIETDEKINSIIRSSFNQKTILHQFNNQDSTLSDNYLKNEEIRIKNDFSRYLKLADFDRKAKAPFLTNDTIVFGLLMLALGLIFYTSSKKDGFWAKFYRIVPALFVAYMLPAVFTTVGLIAPEWQTVSDSGEVSEHNTRLYYMSSRYLLPAALVLMTLSIDLKAVFNLGWKALVMFFTGTVGIIIGGPIAILLISMVHPEAVGGAGPDAVWRGLATLAGSWIGGGANQTAMLEIYGFNQKLYGGMVFVDIVVANVWMAIILIGIGKSKSIDKWFKADTSAIENLKEKVSSYAAEIERNPSLSDLMIMAGIAFGTVSFAHFGAGYFAAFFSDFLGVMENQTTKNIFSFLNSEFFWMISIATLIAIALSFTKAKNYEGAGASKFGSVFIYILVASIGMKMDLTMIFDNLWLLAIGFVWMLIHALLLIGVAKLIRAPYFFLAVGSQANVGGAASAPIVASAFHPSLATVGVLLAVFGYAVGTVGAIACTILMQIVAQ